MAPQALGVVPCKSEPRSGDHGLAAHDCRRASKYAAFRYGEVSRKILSGGFAPHDDTFDRNKVPQGTQDHRRARRGIR